MEQLRTVTVEMTIDTNKETRTTGVVACDSVEQAVAVVTELAAEYESTDTAAGSLAVAAALLRDAGRAGRVWTADAAAERVSGLVDVLAALQQLLPPIIEGFDAGLPAERSDDGQPAADHLARARAWLEPLQVRLGAAQENADSANAELAHLT